MLLSRKRHHRLWLPCLFFIRSPSLNKVATFLSQQKQQLQKKEVAIVSSKQQPPPPIKYPKPPAAKPRESTKQTTEDPLLQSKPLKTPVSLGNQSSTTTSIVTAKPVQPVYPLPDRQPSDSSVKPPLRDKSSSMQQYKLHQSSRSSGGSSGNRPHSLVTITSPTSSLDHSNSDNNSGASTPLLYSERTSPSGSSCNTSVGGGHQQRQHTKPTIALMQHSYAGDSGRRAFPSAEPLDVFSLSQGSNSSRESNNSNRSKREMHSPERQMKFSSPPNNQYNVESHLRSADMPTAALRHSSGGQRLQQGRDEHELYMQPKRLGGYMSDGAMSVTSSIEELSAINLTSDYTDQPLQPNVVIVKPQPVAGTAAYYQHPGHKDRHGSFSQDPKQHVHGGPSSGQGMTSPNSSSKQANSHSYHTPPFPSKGFPPGHHHGQFKNSYPPPQGAVTSSQHWATQRQGPTGNGYNKQGKSLEFNKTISPPSVREGKPRGYLAADGSDYTNEMIVSCLRSCMSSFLLLCVCCVCVCSFSV